MLSVREMSQRLIYDRSLRKCLQKLTMQKIKLEYSFPDARFDIYRPIDVIEMNVMNMA